MTASACRCTPSGWSAAGSFGRRPRPASYRSRHRSSLICWTESIGEIPSTHGVRRRPAKPERRKSRTKLRLIDSERAIYRTNQHDCAGVSRMAETADLPDDNAALKLALIETRAKLSGAQ